MTPTAEDIKRIKTLMPVDMYLYEYAKQLFEQKWETYLFQHKKISWSLQENELDKLKQIQVPNRNPPKLPLVLNGCKSTRLSLNCPSINIHYNYTKFNYTHVYVDSKID